MEDLFKNKINPVGVNIHPQARIIINNTLSFFNEIKEEPSTLLDIDFNQPEELTAKICGVSIEKGLNQDKQARIVINNILTFINEIEADPHKLAVINFNQSIKLTAKVCGVSARTVATIKKECESGMPSIPRLTVRQPFKVTKLDDVKKSVILQIVSDLKSAGEYPSPKKVLEKAKEQIDGFKCSIFSMRIILTDLGFKPSLEGRKKKLNKLKDSSNK